MGSDGDFSRKHVLDAPMLERVRALKCPDVLDLGCGEGRFCRMMSPHANRVVGLDPTQELLQQAVSLGVAEYVLGHAEALPFPDSSFDLVVCYLVLLDIEDAQTALSEVVRVLRPGGTLLIAEMCSWATASLKKGDGWRRDEKGALKIQISHYLDVHENRMSWDGIEIINWHRPQSFYFHQLLKHSMILTRYDQPKASGGYLETSFNMAPFHYIMEWRKTAE